MDVVKKNARVQSARGVFVFCGVVRDFTQIIPETRKPSGRLAAVLQCNRGSRWNGLGKHAIDHALFRSAHVLLVFLQSIEQ